MNMLPKLVVSLCLLLCLLLPACQREVSVAELTSKVGEVERDHAPKVGAFAATSIGAKFLIGDGVKTRKNASATLLLADGAKLALEPSTLVRFLERATGKGGQKLDVELGRAEITTGDQPSLFDTAFGIAIIQPKSTLVLTRSEAGARFEVTIGGASLELKGRKEELRPGSSIEVSIDLAVIERPAPSEIAPAPSASAAPPATGISATIRGEGASLRQPTLKAFRAVSPGQVPIEAGSTLQLSGTGSALLRQGGEQTTLNGPGQYLIGGTNELVVQMQGGSIVLSPTERTQRVAVPGGTVSAEPGAEVGIRTNASGTTVSVSRGSVTVNGNQHTETLARGEEVVLDKSGRIRRSLSRGLSYSDFSVSPGDSFVVHDPAPPTVIAFSVPAECSRGGVVQLVGGKPSSGTMGEGTVNVPLSAGSHRYTVKCFGDEAGASAAQGTITILADAGTRRLPSSAPANSVDTDGRDYTILYQNQLPRISVRWPKAPETGPFRLLVSLAGGKSQSIASAKPSYAFPPGGIPEGTHSLSFEGSGRTSRTTKVTIRFDNATPTASIVSPADRSFAAGASVLVAGTALPGWSVFSGGSQLAMDEQQRFSGQASAAGGQRALLIRFVHPQRGTQFYLRRVAGAP